MKAMSNLLLKSVLSLKEHPEAKVGDVIKLNKADIELAQTCVDDLNLSNLRELYLYVEYIFENDDTIFGSLCQNTSLEIKTGVYDPRDW